MNDDAYTIEFRMCIIIHIVFTSLSPAYLSLSVLPPDFKLQAYGLAILHPSWHRFHKPLPSSLLPSAHFSMGYLPVFSKVYERDLSGVVSGICWQGESLI